MQKGSLSEKSPELSTSIKNSRIISPVPHELAKLFSFSNSTKPSEQTPPIDLAGGTTSRSSIQLIVKFGQVMEGSILSVKLTRTKQSVK